MRLLPNVFSGRFWVASVAHRALRDLLRRLWGGR